jgi:transcriptional regulator with XRE-family HTH domain
MNDKNVRETLERIALPANNNLLEELKWRQANRAWLRKSQAIANKTLGTLRNQGLTQKDLAKKMGVSAQMVNKLLKGSENLTLETISKIEIALGIHLIETAETLKAKISEYEQIIHGISETLKTIVKIFEPKKDTAAHRVNSSNLMSDFFITSTRMAIKAESNIKEYQPQFAMVA